MRKIFTALLMGAMFPAIAVLPAGGQEEKSRSFTNKDGKAIEAVLLEVNGQNARIRRLADDQEFEIPVSSLSLDDQIWIVEWIRQHSRAVRGEWANLRVVFPNPMGSCGVIGLATNCLRDKVGGSEFDLLLPEGAWVKVEVYSGGDIPQPLEHLVQFRGAKRWEFTAEEMHLSLSRDGGAAEIVGISFPSPVTEEWLDDLDERHFAEQVSVEVPAAFDLRQIRWRKSEIVAFTSDYQAESDLLDEIARAKPKAIDLTVVSDSLDRLAGFADLEAMAVQVSIRRTVVDGVRKKATPDDLVVTGFPAVRDLSLHGIPFSPDLQAQLGEKGELRMFHFSVSSNSVTYREPLKWADLGSLADSLESLFLVRGLQIDLAELERLSRLKSIELTASNLDSSQLGSFDPSVFPELLNLRINTSDITAENWAEWAKRGALSKLRRLVAHQMFDVSRIPDLEMARFWASGSAAVSPDLRDIQRAERLRKLSFSGADQDDLEDLAGLPIRDGIEALRLENSTFADLSPLAEMANLKLLELDRSEAGPTKIDLKAFPKLTGFSALYHEKLEAIDGAASHPTLQSLGVSYCDAFRSLGQTAPNVVLRYLNLYRCQALEDLSALDQTTGLTQMTLYDCDLLTEPPAFLEKNSWNYLRVSGCEHLPNLSARSLKR